MLEPVYAYLSAVRLSLLGSVMQCSSVYVHALVCVYLLLACTYVCTSVRVYSSLFSQNKIQNWNSTYFGIVFIVCL